MTAYTLFAIAAAVMALALLNIVINGLLTRRGRVIKPPVPVVGRRRGE